MEKTIEIESFNPFESRFPNRKVISRETLLLIKHLRLEGYQVNILPNDNRHLDILCRRGLYEFFSDPIIIALFGIPITIATTLISNKIQKIIEKKSRVNPENIEIKIHQGNSFYNCDFSGNKLNSNHKKTLYHKNKKLREEFEKSFSRKPPNSEYPTPIFLEHTPKIVGWCILSIDEKGLKVKGFLTEKVIKKRIEQNRINGMSVTVIETKTQCSICKEEYINCNHIAGEKYSDKICYNLILEVDYVETSLVKEPINKECLVNLR